MLVKCRSCLKNKSAENFYSYKPKTRKRCYIDRLCKQCKSDYHKETYSQEKYWNKKYSLSSLEVKRLGDTCAICGSTENLVIDHSHKDGKIRGRLCSQCNTGLGMFKDSAVFLSRATKYLLGMSQIE